MKKVNFLTMAAIALMTGFAGCSNDEGTGNGPVDEGKATLMTVSIKFPKADGPSSRATTFDPNATDAEADVKTVDVFIYTGAGAFLSHTPLSAGDFTGPTDGSTKDEYTADTKITTTTGAKAVYVGINLPAALVTTLTNQPASSLVNAAQTLTRAQLTTIANGLPMFSSVPAEPVLVADDSDPANSVTVEVERLVAKITVESISSLPQAGVQGTLGTLEFAVNNFNQKMFLVQGASPEYKDPNWDSNTLTAPFMTTDFSQAVNADYKQVLDRGTYSNPDVDDYATGNAVAYASENTSKDKLKGEITRVTVRATFIPENIIISDGGSGFVETTTATEGITTADDFWAFTESVASGTKYFYTKAVAEDYALSKGGQVTDIVEYTDGYCYWDMYLNKTSTGKGEMWDVLRNEYFKCTITRIVAPGRPTPEVVPPDVKPDENTSITVDIDVLFWNTPILADYELEP